MTVDHAEPTTWQVPETEQRFKQALHKAHDEGPQFVQHGQEFGVLLDLEEYRRLTSQNPEPDFKEFLLSAPDWPDDLELPRDQDLPREVDLGW